MAGVGERIKKRRVELGWTQDQLCQKAGISKGFLSDLENDKPIPKSKTVMLVHSEAFKVARSEKLVTPVHGKIILVGVAACLAGVFITGLAGRTKELEMPPDQKRGLVSEFNFRKGVLVAAVSGVFSACFAFGLASGNPIKALTLQHGTDVIWQGLPVLVAENPLTSVVIGAGMILSDLPLLRKVVS